MILPNVNTGNSELDYALRLIDEKLSQLYAIHGDMAARTDTANTLRDTSTRDVAGTAGSGGVARSETTGIQSTNSSTYQDVTSASVTLTTNGRPVAVNLIADGSAASYIEGNASTGAAANFFVTFSWVRDGVRITENLFNSYYNAASAQWDIILPPGMMNFVDFPAEGTHNYKLQFKGNGSLAKIEGCKVVAYEL